MLRKTLFLAFAAVLAVLATSSEAWAWRGASVPTFAPPAGHIDPQGRPTPNTGGFAWFPYGGYSPGFFAPGVYRRW